MDTKPGFSHFLESRLHRALMNSTKPDVACVSPGAMVVVMRDGTEIPGVVHGYDETHLFLFDPDSGSVFDEHVILRSNIAVYRFQENPWCL